MHIVHFFSPLMFLQLRLWTVCMSNDPTDTLSDFTTRLTTADCVPAPTGQFTVNASPAPLLHVLTPSHKSAAGPAKVRVLIFHAAVHLHKRLHIWSQYVFVFDSILQAVYMKAESELMGNHGMTCQTHVVCVCVVRDPSNVRGSGVLPSTVTIQCRDNAACPVRVRDSNT